MAIHDTIGDFLTMIRNSSRAGKSNCITSHSKVRVGIAKILSEEGFISSYRESKNQRGHKQIVLQLKYYNGESAIVGLLRYSKPGRRLYCGFKDIPPVLGSLGIAIMSTPKGILASHIARRERLGGEILAKVW